MASLRVRIEFPDNNKFWLFIDLSKFETIQDVIDYIDKEYSVSCYQLWIDDAQLFCRGTVRILQEGDLIRVTMKEPKKRKIETQNNQQNSHNVNPLEGAINSSPPSKPKKKKKSNEDKVTENLTRTQNNQQNSHNVDPLEEAINSSPSSKPKKKKKSNEDENLPSLMPIESSVEAVVTDKKRKKVKQVDSDELIPVLATVVEKQKVVKQVVKVFPPEIETEPTIDEALTELNPKNKESSEEDSAKRKRRRRRRKSHHKSEAVDSSLFEPLRSVSDYVPPAPKERQHVRFDADSGEDTEPRVGHVDARTNGLDILHQPESNGTYNINRAHFENEKTKNSKNNAKPVVNQSPSPASPSVPPQLNALLSLRSAVFSRNSNDKATSPSYNNVPPPQTLTSCKVVPSSPKVPTSLPAKEEPVKLDPTAFPVIKGLPRVNDLIAFKVLELSENYNPEISEYMKGRITYMSPGSDITVELLVPKPKLHSRGKFEILEDDEEEYDEEPEVEYETTVTYHWSQMIEPRLIFP